MKFCGIKERKKKQKEICFTGFRNHNFLIAVFFDFDRVIGFEEEEEFETLLEGFDFVEEEDLVAFVVLFSNNSIAFCKIARSFP